MSVNSLLDAVWEHWVLHRNIPVEVANDMRDELDTHLMEAEAQGKNVVDVVGSDLRSFADEWAAEADQPGGSPLSDVVFSAVGGICGLAFAAAVWNWSLQFSLPLFDSLAWVIYFVVVSLAVFAPAASRLRARPTPMTKSTLSVISSLVGVISFIVLLWVTALLPNNPSISMPTVLTGILASAGFFFVVSLPAHAMGFSPLRFLGRAVGRLGNET